MLVMNRFFIFNKFKFPETRRYCILRKFKMQMDQYFFIYRKYFRIFFFKLKYNSHNLETGKIILIFITAIQQCRLHNFPGHFFSGVYTRYSCDSSILNWIHVDELCRSNDSGIAVPNMLFHSWLPEILTRSVCPFPDEDTGNYLF